MIQALSNIDNEGVVTGGQGIQRKELEVRIFQGAVDMFF